MHVNELQCLILSGENVSWIRPADLELSMPIIEQRHVNEEYQSAKIDEANKPDTDDELISEFIAYYLMNLKHKLGNEASLRILDAIYWVFSEFSSSYVVSLTSEIFASALEQSAKEKVHSQAYQLHSSLDESKQMLWKHLVDAVAEK